MRKLFVQFYLLLVGCFLTVVLLIGSVYGRVVDSASDRYLSDLLTASLTLITSELGNVPPERWSAELAAAGQRLSFPLRIEPATAFNLSEADRGELAAGNIVMLEDEYLFLQRMPDPRYLLVAGPLRYLIFQHQIHWVDYALILVIALSLAIPVLLWMYPLARDLRAFERAALRFGQGRQQVRVDLPPRSGIQRLGGAFNLMVERVNRQMEQRKALTDALAHELRSPVARLRYRLALGAGGDASAAWSASMERDLDEIDALLEEMLLHARLDSPQTPLAPSAIDSATWLGRHLERARALGPTLDWQWQATAQTPAGFTADPHLMGRALDNLLANAARHAKNRVTVALAKENGYWRLTVDDDGAGIAPDDRERVFEPFVRLDASRDRRTGGHGLGLAIVAGIARAHSGYARAEASPSGGARFILAWPCAAMPAQPPGTAQG
ncbi:two-component system sensor histidine kinase RstB [Crenobacter intestini]|uniref:histidine kinase n=1 Tax=Crenobacter intestini TaxID=2563443 RepID=A0A4T0UJC7_9NEIS|nr:two-component system sensor histidine kinase RstB [Crenobacter intestini]TIC78659.1 two-component system sensor histidine kinase RstB [Crenobacter intestini]